MAVTIPAASALTETTMSDLGSVIRKMTWPQFGGDKMQDAFGGQ